MLARLRGKTAELRIAVGSKHTLIRRLLCILSLSIHLGNCRHPGGCFGLLALISAVQPRKTRLLNSMLPTLTGPFNLIPLPLLTTPTPLYNICPHMHIKITAILHPKLTIPLHSHNTFTHTHTQHKHRERERETNTQRETHNPCTRLKILHYYTLTCIGLRSCVVQTDYGRPLARQPMSCNVQA